jgi:hypothetical protein
MEAYDTQLGIMLNAESDIDRWQYDERTGLYFYDGVGIGLQWHEVEEFYNGNHTQ